MRLTRLSARVAKGPYVYWAAPLAMGCGGTVERLSFLVVLSGDRKENVLSPRDRLVERRSRHVLKVLLHRRLLWRRAQHWCDVKGFSTEKLLLAKVYTSTTAEQQQQPTWLFLVKLLFFRSLAHHVPWRHRAASAENLWFADGNYFPVRGSLFNILQVFLTCIS